MRYRDCCGVSDRASYYAMPNKTDGRHLTSDICHAPLAVLKIVDIFCNNNNNNNVRLLQLQS